MHPHNPLFIDERVAAESVSEETNKLVGESSGPSKGERAPFKIFWQLDN